MMMTLKVNGRAQTVDVDPATPLLYVLSDDLELNGPKFGCGMAQCGACTVIVERPSHSLLRHARRNGGECADHDARRPRHARRTRTRFSRRSSTSRPLSAASV